jgi:hypothetical protein
MSGNLVVGGVIGVFISIGGQAAGRILCAKILEKSGTLGGFRPFGAIGAESERLGRVVAP